MKILSKIKGAARNVIIAGAIVTAGMAGFHAVRVHAQDSYNCDANAVVWCGAPSTSTLLSAYNNGDGHNHASSIQYIYSQFGIDRTAIQGMSTAAVNGTVNKDGDVYIGSELVATNALTAGRENIAGSTKVSYNGVTFYKRAPSVSFLQGSLSAYIVMQNGQFKFAILKSCGNPVSATPKKPAISILKQVRAAGTSTYGNNVTVKSGSEVQYQITASSDGQVPADNMTVSDALPSDITYLDNSLEVNGKAVSASNFFSKNGLDLGTVKNGSKEVITFNATAGKTSDTSSSCQAENINNYGYVWAAGLGVLNSHAGVTTTCTPPPQISLTCNNLTLTPGTIDSSGNQAYTLAASASAQNAAITGYTFNIDGSNSAVNSSSTSASTTHTFAPGSHNVSVTVNATASGKTYTATSANCKKSITVQQLGKLVCSNLTLTPGTVESNGDTSYTLNATASATNATINGYAFDFGDGNNKTVTTSATSASTTHTYAPGNYNATVTVNGTINGKSVTETSADCAGSVKVKAPTPVYACDGLTATPAGDADANGNIAYKLVATGIATNATITGYIFDFGDSSQAETVTTGDTSASTIHTYAPGTYTSKATVNVTLSDGTTKQVSSNGCQTQITVKAPTCTAPNGQTYPKGSSECQPTCTAPNGQSYPAGSPNCEVCKYNSSLPANSTKCVPAPTCKSPTTGKTYPMGSSECQAPTVLPNTGAGDIFGIFAGASIAGGLGYRFLLGRRLAREG